MSGEDEKYNGSLNDEGLPDGKGVNIRYENGKIKCVEDGVWHKGFLIEGSETTFFDENNDGSYNIKKEVGKWKFDENKNICDEFLTGEGEELYYANKEDFDNNKPLGYVKGIFDNGKLLEGEVFNAFSIGYSEHSFIKKILIKGKSKKNSTNTRFGEIFFQNGDRYEGEIDFDMPQGDGVMYYIDGTSKKGEWDNGNLKETD